MIRIVTDSAADLTARDLETPGVTVVPMGITFADGTATVDDGSMTKDEFFTRLAEDSKLPAPASPARLRLSSCLRKLPMQGMRSLSSLSRKSFPAPPRAPAWPPP